MSEEKIKNILGMAQRARLIVSGNLAVEEAIKKGKVKMLIVAEDANDATIEALKKVSAENEIPMIKILTKEKLGKALGKEYRAVAALLEQGFCNSLNKIIAKKSSVEEKVNVKK